MAMDDQEKMQRLLRLILLLAGKRRYKMPELQSRTGLTARSIYRYLNTLESVGLSVERGNGYRLEEACGPNKNLSQLFHFSEEEAYVLCQVLEQVGGATKVKEKLLRKFHALYDMHALLAIQTPTLAILNALRLGIQEKKQVLLCSYRSSHSYTIADRLVEPFAFQADYESVWCYDTGDYTCKQFRISRIGAANLLDAAWQQERDHRKKFTDAFRMSAEAPIATVALVLDLHAFNLLQEEFPLCVPHVAEQEDGYHLQVPVANYHGVGRFVLGLPAAIRVVGPEDFVVWLKKMRS